MCMDDEEKPKPPPPPAPPPVETADLKIAPKKTFENKRSAKRKGKRQFRQDLTIATGTSTGSGLAT